jgi:hypothetical protein
MEAAVHLHPSAQHTWPQLSVCMFILCPFCISSHPQLAPFRFSNNKGVRKKLVPPFVSINCYNSFILIRKRFI